MASTYLTRTPSGAGTNSKIFTLSLWIKRCGLGASQAMMGTGTSSGHSSVFLEFDANDRLRFSQINASGASPTFEFEYVTNRVFRDTNGFYNIVCTVDSTNGTEADRVKIYVNGVRETSFSTTNHAGSNTTFLWNDARVHSIGRHGEWNLRYQNGVMSHVHNIDGTAYDASAFGSTDATTGEWKINTSPNVNYGTNGFFLFKDDNAVTDRSGQGNNFTLGGGNLTKTEDCPSNIFNTFNPLVPKHSNLTLLHGNTTLSSTNGQWLGSMTTIPLFGGKWYYECKYNTGYNIKLSIMGYKSDLRHFTQANNSYGEYNDNGYGYQFNNSGNDYLGNNASTPNWGGGLSSNTGDKIYMIAINLENGKIWYGADGTWFDDASGYTGNPTTDAYPHQTISATHLAQKPFVVTGSVEGNGASAHWNFGNGYFGTTAISSEGTNASGIGKFEYDVPTGFTAISTKGLNE